MVDPAAAARCGLSRFAPVLGDKNVSMKKKQKWLQLRDLAVQSSELSYHARLQGRNEKKSALLHLPRPQ